MLHSECCPLSGATCPSNYVIPERELCFSSSSSLSSSSSSLNLFMMSKGTTTARRSSGSGRKTEKRREMEEIWVDHDPNALPGRTKTGAFKRDLFSIFSLSPSRFRSDDEERKRGGAEGEREQHYVGSYFDGDHFSSSLGRRRDASLLRGASRDEHLLDDGGGEETPFKEKNRKEERKLPQGEVDKTVRRVVTLGSSLAPFSASDVHFKPSSFPFPSATSPSSRHYAILKKHHLPPSSDTPLFQKDLFLDGERKFKRFSASHIPLLSSFSPEEYSQKVSNAHSSPLPCAAFTPFSCPLEASNSSLSLSSSRSRRKKRKEEKEDEGGRLENLRFPTGESVSRMERMISTGGKGRNRNIYSDILSMNEEVEEEEDEQEESGIKEAEREEEDSDVIKWTEKYQKTLQHEIAETFKCNPSHGKLFSPFQEGAPAHPYPFYHSSGGGCPSSSFLLSRLEHMAFPMEVPWELPCHVPPSCLEFPDQIGNTLLLGCCPPPPHCPHCHSKEKDEEDDEEEVNPPPPPQVGKRRTKRGDAPTWRADAAGAASALVSSSPNRNTSSSSPRSYTSSPQVGEDLLHLQRGGNVNKMKKKKKAPLLPSPQPQQERIRNEDLEGKESLAYITLNATVGKGNQDATIRVGKEEAGEEEGHLHTHSPIAHRAANHKNKKGIGVKKKKEELNVEEEVIQPEEVPVLRDKSDGVASSRTRTPPAPTRHNNSHNKERSTNSSRGTTAMRRRTSSRGRGETHPLSHGGTAEASSTSAMVTPTNFHRESEKGGGNMKCSLPSTMVGEEQERGGRGRGMGRGARVYDPGRAPCHPSRTIIRNSIAATSRYTSPNEGEKEGENEEEQQEEEKDEDTNHRQVPHPHPFSPSHPPLDGFTIVAPPDEEGEGAEGEGNPSPSAPHHSTSSSPFFPSASLPYGDWKEEAGGKTMARWARVAAAAGGGAGSTTPTDHPNTPLLPSLSFSSPMNLRSLSDPIWGREVEEEGGRIGSMKRRGVEKEGEGRRRDGGDAGGGVAVAGGSRSSLAVRASPSSTVRTTKHMSSSSTPAVQNRNHAPLHNYSGGKREKVENSNEQPRGRTTGRWNPKKKTLLVDSSFSASSVPPPPFSSLPFSVSPPPGENLYKEEEVEQKKGGGRARESNKMDVFTRLTNPFLSPSSFSRRGRKPPLHDSTNTTATNARRPPSPVPLTQPLSTSHELTQGWTRALQQHWKTLKTHRADSAKRWRRETRRWSSAQSEERHQTLQHLPYERERESAEHPKRQDFRIHRSVSALGERLNEACLRKKEQLLNEERDRREKAERRQRRREIEKEEKEKKTAEEKEQRKYAHRKREKSDEKKYSARRKNTDHPHPPHHHHPEEKRKTSLSIPPLASLSDEDEYKDEIKQNKRRKGGGERRSHRAFKTLTKHSLDQQSREASQRKSRKRTDGGEIRERERLGSSRDKIRTRGKMRDPLLAGSSSSSSSLLCSSSSTPRHTRGESSPDERVPPNDAPTSSSWKEEKKSASTSHPPHSEDHKKENTTDTVHKKTNRRSTKGSWAPSDSSASGENREEKESTNGSCRKSENDQKNVDILTREDFQHEKQSRKNGKETDSTRGRKMLINDHTPSSTFSSLSSSRSSSSPSSSSTSWSTGKRWLTLSASSSLLSATKRGGGVGSSAGRRSRPLTVQEIYARPFPVKNVVTAHAQHSPRQWKRRDEGERKDEWKVKGKGKTSVRRARGEAVREVDEDQDDRTSPSSRRDGRRIKTKRNSASVLLMNKMASPPFIGSEATKLSGRRERRPKMKMLVSKGYQQNHHDRNNNHKSTINNKGKRTFTTTSHAITRKVIPFHVHLPADVEVAHFPFRVSAPSPAVNTQSQKKKKQSERKSRSKHPVSGSSSTRGRSRGHHQHHYPFPAPSSSLPAATVDHQLAPGVKIWRRKTAETNNNRSKTMVEEMGSTFPFSSFLSRKLLRSSSTEGNDAKEDHHHHHHKSRTRKEGATSFLSSSSQDTERSTCYQSSRRSSCSYLLAPLPPREALLPEAKKKSSARRLSATTTTTPSSFGGSTTDADRTEKERKKSPSSSSFTRMRPPRHEGSGDGFRGEDGQRHHGHYCQPEEFPTGAEEKEDGGDEGDRRSTNKRGAPPPPPASSSHPPPHAHPHRQRGTQKKGIFEKHPLKRRVGVRPTVTIRGKKKKKGEKQGNLTLSQDSPRHERRKATGRRGSSTTRSRKNHSFSSSSYSSSSSSSSSFPAWIPSPSPPSSALKGTYSRFLLEEQTALACAPDHKWEREAEGGEEHRGKRERGWGMRMRMDRPSQVPCRDQHLFPFPPPPPLPSSFSVSHPFSASLSECVARRLPMVIILGEKEEEGDLGKNHNENLYFSSFRRYSSSSPPQWAGVQSYAFAFEKRMKSPFSRWMEPSEPLILPSPRFCEEKKKRKSDEEESGPRGDFTSTAKRERKGGREEFVASAAVEGIAFFGREALLSGFVVQDDQMYTASVELAHLMVALREEIFEALHQKSFADGVPSTKCTTRRSMRIPNASSSSSSSLAVVERNKEGGEAEEAMEKTDQEEEEEMEMEVPFSLPPAWMRQQERLARVLAPSSSSSTDRCKGSSPPSLPHYYSSFQKISWQRQREAHDVWGRNSGRAEDEKKKKKNNKEGEEEEEENRIATAASLPVDPALCFQQAPPALRRIPALSRLFTRIQDKQRLVALLLHNSTTTPLASITSSSSSSSTSTATTATTAIQSTRTSPTGLSVPSSLLAQDYLSRVHVPHPPPLLHTLWEGEGLSPSPSSFPRLPLVRLHHENLSTSSRPPPSPSRSFSLFSTFASARLMANVLRAIEKKCISEWLQQEFGGRVSSTSLTTMTAEDSTRPTMMSPTLPPLPALDEGPSPSSTPPPVEKEEDEKEAVQDTPGGGERRTTTTMRTPASSASAFPPPEPLSAVSSGLLETVLREAVDAMLQLHAKREEKGQKEDNKEKVRAVGVVVEEGQRNHGGGGGPNRLPWGEVVQGKREKEEEKVLLPPPSLGPVSMMRERLIEEGEEGIFPSNKEEKVKERVFLKGEMNQTAILHTPLLLSPPVIKPVVTEQEGGTGEGEGEGRIPPPVPAWPSSSSLSADDKQEKEEKDEKKDSVKSQEGTLPTTCEVLSNGIPTATTSTTSPFPSSSSSSSPAIPLRNPLLHPSFSPLSYSNLLIPVPPNPELQWLKDRPPAPAPTPPSSLSILSSNSSFNKADEKVDEEQQHGAKRIRTTSTTPTALRTRRGEEISSPTVDEGGRGGTVGWRTSSPPPPPSVSLETTKTSTVVAVVPSRESTMTILPVSLAPTTPIPITTLHVCVELASPLQEALLHVSQTALQLSSFSSNSPPPPPPLSSSLSPAMVGMTQWWLRWTIDIVQQEEARQRAFIVKDEEEERKQKRPNGPATPVVSQHAGLFALEKGKKEERRDDHHENNDENGLFTTPTETSCKEKNIALTGEKEEEEEGGGRREGPRKAPSPATITTLTTTPKTCQPSEASLPLPLLLAQKREKELNGVVGRECGEITSVRRQGDEPCAKVGGGGERREYPQREEEKEDAVAFQYGKCAPTPIHTLPTWTPPLLHQQQQQRVVEEDTFRAREEAQKFPSLLEEENHQECGRDRVTQFILDWLLLFGEEEKDHQTNNVKKEEKEEGREKGQPFIVKMKQQPQPPPPPQEKEEKDNHEHFASRLPDPFFLHPSKLSSFMVSPPPRSPLSLEEYRKEEKRRREKEKEKEIAEWEKQIRQWTTAMREDSSPPPRQPSSFLSPTGPLLPPTPPPLPPHFLHHLLLRTPEEGRFVGMPHGQRKLEHERCHLTERERKTLPCSHPIQQGEKILVWEDEKQRDRSPSSTVGREYENRNRRGNHHQEIERRKGKKKENRKEGKSKKQQHRRISFVLRGIHYPAQYNKKRCSEGSRTNTSTSSSRPGTTTTSTNTSSNGHSSHRRTSRSSTGTTTTTTTTTTSTTAPSSRTHPTWPFFSSLHNPVDRFGASLEEEEGVVGEGGKGGENETTSITTATTATPTPTTLGRNWFSFSPRPPAPLSSSLPLTPAPVPVSSPPFAHPRSPESSFPLPGLKTPSFPIIRRRKGEEAIEEEDESLLLLTATTRYTMRESRRSSPFGAAPGWGVPFAPPEEQEGGKEGGGSTWPLPPPSFPLPYPKEDQQDASQDAGKKGNRMQQEEEEEEGVTFQQKSHGYGRCVPHQVEEKKVEGRERAAGAQGRRREREEEKKEMNEGEEQFPKILSMDATNDSIPYYPNGGRTGDYSPPLPYHAPHMIHARDGATPATITTTTTTPIPPTTSVSPTTATTRLTMEGHLTETPSHCDAHLPTSSTSFSSSRPPPRPESLSALVVELQGGRGRGGGGQWCTPLASWPPHALQPLHPESLSVVGKGNRKEEIHAKEVGRAVTNPTHQRTSTRHYPQHGNNKYDPLLPFEPPSPSPPSLENNNNTTTNHMAKRSEVGSAFIKQWREETSYLMASPLPTSPPPPPRPLHVGFPRTPSTPTFSTSTMTTTRVTGAALTSTTRATTAATVTTSTNTTRNTALQAASTPMRRRGIEEETEGGVGEVSFEKWAMRNSISFPSPSPFSSSPFPAFGKKNGIPKAFLKSRSSMKGGSGAERTPPSPSSSSSREWQRGPGGIGIRSSPTLQQHKELLYRLQHSSLDF